MKRLMTGAAIAASFYGSVAAAQTVSVLATADLYQPAGATSGTTPYSTAVTGGATLTFSATGSISFNIGSGSNFNDPDGVGSVSSINVSSLGKFSGFSAPRAGSLVGVFFNNAQKLTTGPAAATIDFNVFGTGFASLSPLLNQVFFIGDGLTGDGTGAVQNFIAPIDATGLILGFADAPGYNGSPGSYEDNSGTLRVTITGAGGVAGAVPEPATWAMMMIGLGAAGFAMRRRQRVVARVAYTG